MDRSQRFRARCVLEASDGGVKLAILRYSSNNTENAYVDGTATAKKSAEGKKEIVIANYQHRNTFFPISSNRSSFYSNVWKAFSKLENNSNSSLKFEEGIDTSNNMPFVDSDAHHNNKLFATGAVRHKLRHKTTLASAVGPVKGCEKHSGEQDQVSSLNSRQSLYTREDLSKAKVSNFDTDEALDEGSVRETTAAKQSFFRKSAERLKFQARWNNIAPVSFYTKRRSDSGAEEDDTAMKEYDKTADDVCEEIKNILQTVPPDSTERALLERKLTENSQLLNKQPLEYRIVDVPSIQRVDLFQNNQTPKFVSHGESFGSLSSLSVSTSTSSPRSLADQPFVPNPSPQLDPDRCQIFSTSDPNTFHAYTSGSSRPTIISKGHLVENRRSENKQRKNKKTLVGGSVKTLLNDGVKSDEAFTRGTLLQGRSIRSGAIGKSNFPNVVHVDTENERNGDAAAASSKTNNSEIKVEKPSENERCALTSDTVNLKGESRSLKEHGRQDQPKYTPVHSLVVKSCQTLNPVLVAPELPIQASDASSVNIDFVPTRIKADRRSLSPLKSVCIFKHKIARKCIEDRTGSAPERIGLKGLLKESRSQRVRPHNTAKVQSTGFSNGFLPERLQSEDNVSPDDVMSSKRTSLDGKRNKPDLAMHNVGIAGKSVAIRPQNSSQKAFPRPSFSSDVNLDHLCLNGDKAPSYLLLKEGTSQSLKFINTSQTSKYSIAPIFSEDTKVAVEKLAQSRGHAPLGSINGSSNSGNVKQATGGGFKSNVVRYSLFLRQKYYKHLEDLARKQLEQESLLTVSQAKLKPSSQCLYHLEECSETIADTMCKLCDSAVNETVEDVEKASDVTEGDVNGTVDPSHFNPHDKLSESGNHLSFACRNEEVQSRESAANDKSLEPSDQHNLQDSTLNSTSNANLTSANTLDSSPPILPDPSTASYRLTHDVSFDEGSRCKGTNRSSLSVYKSHEDQRNGSHARQLSYTNNEEYSSRFDKSTNSSTRDRQFGPSLSLKEPHNIAFVRADEMQNSSHGLSASLASRAQSSHFANGSESSMQHSSASAFRAVKDARQNWNHRTGDPSVNDGGNYGSNLMQPGGRVDMSDLVSLSISPASSFTQKVTQSRDKNGATSMKSRLCSKYGNRFDGLASIGASSGKEILYADPYIGAPPSFQQRLTELSILETDTIKYERNRKMKRKSKTDKES